MFSFEKFLIKRTTRNCHGYSMLELILAAAVGSIIIAGGYTSFVVLSKQYSRVSAFSEVQQAGIPSIRIISRDLRMAGRVAMDTNVDPVYGAIANPITITDSGNACCDSITVIYDKDSTVNPQRCQITYDIRPRTNPARNALYMTVTTLLSDAGDPCLGDGATSLVADYIEDLQFVGSDNNSNGDPQLVDVSIIARSQSTLSSTNTYTRPDQTIGNYNFSFTDNLHRDEFTTTINIKNLRGN
ncbi:MAG: hypothetical protein COV35_02385 [Alphaproteobacteria bacterium CG11_big_fil_rev_8_21_14_0_20_39_49]|nr:MAG: hypothetical protein COV35_02385 [Alphaproteobacteria bacterium CG11_big_fil_rev_8_21_14_0_20_39_49]